ncbi:hypothetical protein TrRE_jg8931 [Triparma retinervis]|uniref:D-xylose 1-dehydrogenase (NADP(+), D-xylono-1,5-lactone-forming) n=1 Tax=Triparma retinervis TaxID=2557542 RepID=A0A9W6ZN60_9STRA|nr:hypothetical protein TrRE_jg8931 [Triparma retinervis]
MDPMAISAPLDVVLTNTASGKAYEDYASPDHNSFLLSTPPLKWGILGTGRICNDFTQSLKLIPSAEVVACASRNSLPGAEGFAEKHGIPRSYGTYEQMCGDEDVEIVYVGNVHLFRREVGEMVLKAGKHCLLEKPIALSKSDAVYLTSLASSLNLFLSEGMWTRYFPAIEHVRSLISDCKIGTVTAFKSDFHFHTPDQESYPGSPLYDPRLAGGSAMYLASYPISGSLCCFPTWPDKVVCNGIIDGATGVDTQGTISLRFPPPPGAASAAPGERLDGMGGGMANLDFGFLGESAEETTIIGTGGRIVVHGPAHCPTKVTVHVKVPGSVRGEASVTEAEFPLPRVTEEVRESGGFYYPNSQGLAYEASAVARCVARGERETPQYTAEESVKVMEIIDEYRKHGAGLCGLFRCQR